MAKEKNSKDTQIHLRVKSEEKEQVQQILSECGTNLNAVIDMLLKAIIHHRGIPFSVTLPKERPKEKRVEIEELLEELKEVEESNWENDELYYDPSEETTFYQRQEQYAKQIREPAEDIVQEEKIVLEEIEQTEEELEENRYLLQGLEKDLREEALEEQRKQEGEPKINTIEEAVKEGEEIPLFFDLFGTAKEPQVKEKKPSLEEEIHLKFEFPKMESEYLKKEDTIDKENPFEKTVLSKESLRDSLLGETTSDIQESMEEEEEEVYISNEELEQELKRMDIFLEHL